MIALDDAEAVEDDYLDLRVFDLLPGEIACSVCWLAHYPGNCDR